MWFDHCFGLLSSFGGFTDEQHIHGEAHIAERLGFLARYLDRSRANQLVFFVNAAFKAHHRAVTFKAVEDDRWRHFAVCGFADRRLAETGRRRWWRRLCGGVSGATGSERG